MPKNDSTRHDTAPSWYTPVRLLALLCVLNTAIYVDRGSFASNSVNGNPEKSTGFQVTATILCSSTALIDSVWSDCCMQ